MAQTITFNGVVYTIPDVGDDSWGSNLTNYFVALPQGSLQKTGGTFTLSNDVNFGASFGLLSSYFKTRGLLPATAGLLRLNLSDTIAWRNNANSANLALAINGSDQLTFNGSAIYPGAITALTGDVTATGPGSVASTIAANAVSNAKFRQSAALSLVGNSTNALSNVADIVAASDFTLLMRSGTSLAFNLLTNNNIDAAAAIAYSKLALTGSILNADISATAAIAFSKLAALTSGNILVGNVSNVAASVAMSGDVTISNAGVTSIGANKVTLAQMAQIATASFLGRTTAATGNVESLSATQATALLNNFVGDSGSGGTKGLVPAPASGDAAALKYLKADGTWGVPAGAGTVTSVAMTVPSIFAVSGSPVTTNGTLAITLANQSANTLLAGPSSGAAAAPTFRAFVAADYASAHAPITASLAADVNLNNISSYFDGPSIAQGTSGVWFVSASVLLVDAAGSGNFNVKLWDGTTVIASVRITSGGANFWTPVSLGGYISSPAGNLKISVQDVTSTNGLIKFNASGNSKDSTITAIRIG